MSSSSSVPTGRKVTVQPSAAKPLPTFKQHAGTVHTASKMTLVERKLAAAMMAAASRHEERLKSDRRQKSLLGDNLEVAPSPYYDISLSELCKLSGVTGTNNMQHVKNSLRALMSKPVEFNVLNNAGDEEWRAFAWVSEVVISAGQVRFAFPPSLAEKVRDPTMWTLNQLAITTLFDSKYSHALYQNCQRFRSLRSTGEIDVPTWRRLLDATEPSYDQFKNLRRRVLEPAIDEVNRVSDIELEPHWIKQSRSVVAIRFTIKEKRAIKSLEVDGSIVPNTEQVFSSSAEPTTTNASDTTALALEKLLFVGVTKKTAVAMATEDASRALRITEYAQALDRDRGVKTNIAGLIVTLFRDGFEPSGSRYSDSRQADLLNQSVAAEQARLSRDVDAARAKEQRNRALDRIATADDDEIERWLVAFAEYDGFKVQAQSFNRGQRTFPRKVDQLRFVTFMQLHAT